MSYRHNLRDHSRGHKKGQKPVLGKTLEFGLSRGYYSSTRPVGVRDGGKSRVLRNDRGYEHGSGGNCPSLKTGRKRKFGCVRSKLSRKLH